MSGISPESKSRGEEPASPTTAPAALRADILRLAELFEDADRRLKRAQTLTDHVEATTEWLAAQEQLYVAGSWLADFLLLLLRYARRYQPDALRMYLRESLREELEAMARFGLGEGGRP
jgi:hypothetical protein